MMRNVKVILGILAFVAIPVLVSAATLNEIRIATSIEDPSDDYFELAGTPGESLTGLTYIVIGDDPSNSSGWVECVVSLDGFNIAADGAFLYVEATYSQSCGDTPDVISTTHPLTFEDEDNVTHMLVSGFTGAIGTDLDTDDDGILDITPWASIVDDMAFLDSNAAVQDQYYSLNTVSANRPSHAAFCGGSWVMLDRELCTQTETPGELSDDLCGPVADTKATFGALKAMYR